VNAPAEEVRLAEDDGRGRPESAAVAIDVGGVDLSVIKMAEIPNKV
jgi:hypothetical protein